MSSPAGAFVDVLGQNWLGKADIVVQSVLLAFGFVVLGLRLWSRRLERVSLQWNDWLIVGAMLVMIGRYVVELVLILHCGMGIHADEVARIGGPDVFVQLDKLTYAGDLLWITVVALIQLSILHYSLRRFLLHIIWWGVYILMGLSSALWIASFFATAFFCTPPKKIWLNDTEGHCGNRKMLYTGCAASEVILNGLILLLSVPGVWHMRLPRGRKIALAAIYTQGVLIIVASAIRIETGIDIDSNDPTYGSARTSLLTCIVPLLGIIVACLPVLAPAIQKTMGPSTLSSNDSHHSSPVSPGYWKTTVLSGAHMEEPEIPLVTVTQPRMAKKLSELAHGQIQITSGWEIHSTRNSARVERDSLRRG